MRTEGSRVPADCTLPTEAQPLRVAEFDALFADAVTAPHLAVLDAIRARIDAAVRGRPTS